MAGKDGEVQVFLKNMDINLQTIFVALHIV